MRPSRALWCSWQCSWWCATGSVCDCLRIGPPRKVSKAHYPSLDDAMAENDEQTASYIQKRHLAQRMIMMAQQYANKQESGVVHTALGTFQWCHLCVWVHISTRCLDDECHCRKCFRRKKLLENSNTSTSTCQRSMSGLALPSKELHTLYCSVRPWLQQNMETRCEWLR